MQTTNSLKQKMCFHYVYGHTISPVPQLLPEGVDAALINGNYFSEKLGLIQSWTPKKSSSVHLEIIYGHWREDHTFLEYYLSGKNHWTKNLSGRYMTFSKIISVRRCFPAADPAPCPISG